MTIMISAEAPPPAAPMAAHSLEAALREVEPAVVLAPAWCLRQVIARDRGRGASPFTVSHRDFHVIDRERLLRIAAEEALDLPADLPAAHSLILLTRPEPDWLVDRSSGETLRHYWRLLFHARIDSEMRAILQVPSCPPAEIEARIERIGRVAFNEARFVLQRERHLPFAIDPRKAYAKFAAVYLELHYFRPDLPATYFPAIRDETALLTTLASDVDAPMLLRQTRPRGADDPSRARGTDAAGEENFWEPSARPELRRRAAGDDPRRTALLARADHAAATGNIVRSAILRQRVAHAAHLDAAIQADAFRALDLLIARLKSALQLSGPVTSEWRSVLGAVLPRAAAVGWWNAESRLLYDLQKVCIEHEQEMYSVGVIEWLLEFGRRPLCRPQPNQRTVLMCKALRSALRRVPAARVTTAQRTHLTHLLHDALHHTEARLRETLRPAIVESLAAGDLQPTCAVERVAEQKLVEELLDGLTHRGFLGLGSVRDAISQNQLKLHDLTGVRQFFGRDQLLRIDRRLSDTLDGVYHRGEIYLRFFQRASSLLFATRAGRWITRTIIMPLGGSFLILEAFDHTLFLFVRWLTGWRWLVLSRLELNDFRDESLRWLALHNIPFILLALVLLGALNWPSFRWTLFRGLRGLGRAMRRIFVDAPRWLAARPWMRAIANSREARLILRYIVKPLFFVAVVWIVLPRSLAPHARRITFTAVFAGANLLLNSRPGRALEQAALHWLRGVWSRVTADIIANVLSGVAHFFQRVLESIDRTLYAVDEWLRFRAGQKKSSLFFKAAIGIGWFYIAYFTRFAINLLVEPQVNPIKHFPVVTVSHKIIWSQVLKVTALYSSLGISARRAGTMAAVTLTIIPGIFGFLAWELRSNWKLYAANRSPALKPVQVGSHGETMRRLLRPGFHSGTIPRLFDRLRRAGRDVHRPGLPGHHARVALHKHLETAAHIREAVAHFIQRELIALLDQHPAWRDTPISLTGVTLMPTRIAIELSCTALGPTPATLFFEQRRGWMLAGFEIAGWLPTMPSAQTATFSNALLGLYKIAGVELVKQHIEQLFGPELLAFELSESELTIWKGRRFDQPLVIRLNDHETGTAPGSGILPRLLLDTPVLWEAWLYGWEQLLPQPTAQCVLPS